MNSVSVLQNLSMQIEQAPDSAAVYDTRGGVWSGQQLARRIQAIARGFMAAGLQPGHRVLFAVRPDAAAVTIMMGISAAGGVLVPLDVTMGPALFAARMKLLAPQWVVAESVLLWSSTHPLIVRWLARRGIQLPPLTKIKDAVSVRVGPVWPGMPASLSSATLQRQGQQSDTALPQPGDDDEAMIVFTSGTTGSPKAVVHTRRSMQGVFDTVGSLLDTGSGDRIYACDLHLILPALFAGSAVVVPRRRRFSARRLIRDLKKFKVTHFFAVAAELQQVVDHLQSRKQTLPPSIRDIWIGAAPVRVGFLSRLQRVVASGTRVWCVYGMTEILPVARVSLAEKLQFDGAGDLVGHCVPGVSARVAPDGELILQGPNLFSGYFGQTRCTEHATGDLARLDAGRIVLLGRRKDMIIRGQFNIYPELYETTIERIAGVKRCAMVGWYDDTIADERVVLAVEACPGIAATELKKSVWDALRHGPCSIDSRALPDDIIITTLPLGGRSGKVDKERLRELAQQEFVCALQ